MAIVQVVIMLVNESVNAKKGSAVTISRGFDFFCREIIYLGKLLLLFLMRGIIY